MKIVHEFCCRHMHGPFLDTPWGLHCIECLKDAGELSDDYEPCSECNHDHEYESAEAAKIHCQWAAEDRLDSIKSGDFE